MIVFWRLLLAYYICAVLFYNRRFFAWRDKHPVSSYVLQISTFFVLGITFCARFIYRDWLVAEFWPVPGYWAVFMAAVCYALLNRLLVERPGQEKGHTVVFLLHDTLMIAFLLACSPLDMLYETGNFMLEPWTVFAVAVLIITKMFSVFIYMVEQDWYGNAFPTLDESFVTMLMRLIFFLIILLPGWRWVLWFLVWLWACLIAKKNRLMDLSPFAMYFSIFGSMAVGFLVRYGWYLDL